MAISAEGGGAMRETELMITTDDGLAVAGSWVQPVGEGPFPAVVLLGAGKLDRDGNQGKTRIAFGPPLAAALAERGIASYRYDRRGVGHTPGDWSDGGIYRHRDDAAGVVRAIADRPEVSSLGLVGLSEGAAVHAAWLASRTDAQAVVLVGCVAKGGWESIAHWAESLRKDEIAAPLRWMLRLRGRTAGQQIHRLCDRIAAGHKRIYGFTVPQWLRQFVLHDPQPDLANIHVPVLAITGSKDRQVDPNDLEAIRDLVPGPVDIHRFPDLTHMLRRDPGPASLRAYKEQFTRPIEPELITEITDWLAAHLTHRRHASK